MSTSHPKRRDFLQGAAGLGSLAALGTSARVKAQSGATLADGGAVKPNIIVFVADDAGADHFGIYGNLSATTPNIDAMGRAGLVADRAILTTPQCSPSRISILSGLHPHATDAEDLHTPLPGNIRLVPSYLQDAGYYTGGMKKMHIGPNGEAQFNWYRDSLNQISDFLDAAGSSPFFMWVGFSDPHRPYRPDRIEKVTDPDSIVVPPWMIDNAATRTELAHYYDEIARMDRNIGAMMAEIGKRGLADNTLALVISDNGAPFPREKGTLYDSGIRTPFVAQWPGRITPGTRHQHLISVIDLAPTFLELAGLAIPSHFHGQSMAQGLTDPTRLSRAFAYSQRNWHNTDEHLRSVRNHRFKLISNAYLDLQAGVASDIGEGVAYQELRQARRAGTLTPRQEQLFTRPRPAFELYDLHNDPLETENVIDKPVYGEVQAEMMAQLQRWMQETGDFPASRRRRTDNVDRETGLKPEGAPRLPPFIQE